MAGFVFLSQSIALARVGFLVGWHRFCYTSLCWEEQKRGWEQHRQEKDRMPRVPLYALIWSQGHSRYDLYTQGELSQSFRPEDRNTWLTWLPDAASFAFQGVSGRLNVYL
ncbi:MAG TPA: hypothetical protein VKR06_10090, partial [Ktedonosporobacter sp.]|nr:hypothetical protein [Ktedonosporobacter sp.]